MGSPAQGNTAGGPRGLINQIDTKAKCRHLKNLPVKRLCGRSLPDWGPLPPMAPRPPLLHTVYVCIGYLFTQGRKEGGGGERWTREKVRGATVHKAGSRNTNMTDCISSPKTLKKHLPQSPFTGQFLKMTTICFGVNLVSLMVNGAPLHGNVLTSVLQLLQVFSTSFGRLERKGF